MPIQAPQWTEFLSCPVCYNVFNETHYRPISLACGHTVCRSCLCKLQQRKCPFDQSLISRDVEDLPVNFALLQLVCATASPEHNKGCVPDEFKRFYESSKRCVEELALLLKPVSSSSSGSIIAASTSSANTQNASNCVLSRPMQRKLITLVNCQLVEDEGRARALRAARSLGERTVTELILQHQNPQQLSSNLWASVRGRGCQFLGPAMQEEVMKLILLALEDGSALSRKVLVLFVVQRLETHFPQASKTAIGHVVQLLYRASCFKVTKREEESSLMQLKEEYRTYETLRREHDSQVVQIAMEAGLRIAPDQWSSLLYGDASHKSHMQSIIDKLQTPQTFSQSVSELLIALQRTGDPHNLQRLRPELEFLSSIDPSPDIPVPSWENLDGVMKAVHTVVEGLVEFLQNVGTKKHEYLAPYNARYKTSMCRDYMERRNCPRGISCTFAHSEEELEKYRHKNKRGFKGMGPVPPGVAQHGDSSCVEDGNEEPYRPNRQDVTAMLKSMNINVTTGPDTKKPSRGWYPNGPQNSGLGHMPAKSVPVVPSPIVMETTTSVSVTPPIPSLIGAVPAMTTMDIHQEVVTPTGDHPVLSNGGDRNTVQHNMTTPPVQVHNMGIVHNPSPMGNVNMHQGVVPGVGHAPNMVAPPTPGMMQMGPMQGVMPPFIPPFGGPGQGMHGPRFPIHPMMYYGQYPYMPPYMPYYPPGCAPPDNPNRLPDDNYYTSLNPFAEPWNPGSGPRPHLGQGGVMYPDQMNRGSIETCALCSQRQQEEQRHQQQEQHIHHSEGHFCKQHSPNCQDGDQSQGYHSYQGHQGHSQGPKHLNGPPVVTSRGDASLIDGQQMVDNYEINSGNSAGYSQRPKREGQGHKNIQGQHDITQDYHGADVLHEENYGQGKVQANYGKGHNDQNAAKSHHKHYNNDHQEHYYQQYKAYGDRKTANNPNTDDPQLYDQHGWSVTEDEDDYKEEECNATQYQHHYDDTYDDGYDNTYLDNQYSEDGQLHPDSMYSHSHQDYYRNKMENQPSKGKRVKKHTKVPILCPTEPNAKVHRQSLKNLQERRNTLLAQLQELNKQFEGHYGDEDEMLEDVWNEDSRKLQEKGLNVEQSLPDLFRPTYELVQVDESEAYAKTLEHPHPLDVGPISLKSELLSNGDIFERLGAISGVPPRSVNDSIMTSWMTATLNNNSKTDDDNFMSVCQSEEEDLQQQGIPYSMQTSLITSQPPEETIVQTAKSTDGWRNVDKDFPYLKDVISNLESPMPTPPTTPKPMSGLQSMHLSSHYNSVSGTYSSSMMSYSGLSSGPSVSSSTRPYVSTSYMSSKSITSSIASAQEDVNMNSTNFHSSATPSSSSWNEMHDVEARLSMTTRSHVPSTMYNLVASYDPNDAYTSSSNYNPHSYGGTEDFWTTISQTTSFDTSSPLSYLSSTNSYVNDDHIPFVEGSPTISKFGPISRVSTNKQVKTSGLLKATADETVKTVPVTAVTPLEGPPLPNASTVPSRFVRNDDGHYSTSKTSSETQVTFDKVYSLWASEVNILEQKAKDASTEDEKISVKLQAVEMQITLKQQELKQAHAVNLNSSEYMKRELNNTT